MKLLSLLSKLFSSEKQPKVGWYAFSNGKFSKNPSAYRDLKGVVAWVSPEENSPCGKRGLIITPEEHHLQWKEAINYCLGYNFHGVRSQEGVLPSKEQWMLMISNRNKINKSFMKIVGTGLFFQYWSSSACEGDVSWCINAYDGFASRQEQNVALYVRCVVTF